MLLWRLITSFIGNTEAHLYPHCSSVVTEMRPRESQMSTHRPSRPPTSTFNYSFCRWCEFSVSLSGRFYTRTMSLGGKKEYHISSIAWSIAGFDEALVYRYGTKETSVIGGFWLVSPFCSKVRWLCLAYGTQNASLLNFK